MQIIITGGGEIGYTLAKTLAPNHELHVIDQDPAVADRFHALDVTFVQGSGTSAQVLRHAGVESSALLIACTGLDEVNIVACSIAKQLGTREAICFVSKDDFVGTLGGPNSLHEHFGVDRVVWPEAQLAAAIERIISAPGAIEVEAFVGGEVQLHEYRLEAGSPLTAGPIASLRLPRGVVVVAVKRGEMIEIPRGQTQLSAGDKVIVMGTREAVHAVHARVTDQRRVPARAQLVTIIGGGDVGYWLAQRLDQLDHVRLRVIERDPSRGEMLAATLSSALILNGDGTDLELLEAEEIGRDDVLVCVIDNDERNLLASLLGRQLGVGKVITRVSKAANLRLFERVGIDVALSARGAAVASVVHRIEGGKSDLLAVVEQGRARVLELTVPAGHRAMALRHLGLPPASVVGAVVRGSEAIVPHGDTEVRAGDRLLVFCTEAAADQVRGFFMAEA